MANETAKKSSAREGYEDIYIDKGASEDEPNLFVGINGVNYILPKGKTASVPAHVAAEIRRSKRAQEIRDENSEKLIEAAKVPMPALSK